MVCYAMVCCPMQWSWMPIWKVMIPFSYMPLLFPQGWLPTIARVNYILFWWFLCQCCLYTQGWRAGPWTQCGWYSMHTQGGGGTHGLDHFLKLFGNNIDQHSVPFMCWRQPWASSSTYTMLNSQLSVLHNISMSSHLHLYMHTKRQPLPKLPTFFSVVYM